MSEINGLLTVIEAAKVIGVSHSQVTRYVNQGLLPAKRISQTILISEQDARDFKRPPRGNPKLLQKTC